MSQASILYVTLGEEAALTVVVPVVVVEGEAEVFLGISAICRSSVWLVFSGTSAKSMLSDGRLTEFTWRRADQVRGAPWKTECRLARKGERRKAGGESPAKGRDR